MARIKVTGYIDTDNLLPEAVDLEHETGLTDKGFLTLSNNLGLEDAEFELEEG